MVPCSLRRQDALVGNELATRLQLDLDMESSGHEESLCLFEPSKERNGDSGDAGEVTGQTLQPLSRLEAITGFPPIVESLLAQLPTVSILNLFHTSRYLRDFFKEYPLAWRTLSFRVPPPALILGSPGLEIPEGTRTYKQYALDALLIQVVVPLATRLRSLDLCNTAISGVALIANVLSPRIDTIQHLSVRGCKNVSIKYHIVPFLQLHSPIHSPCAKPNELALKSLYTYRCRHHRRRPYLPSSLVRRDSDSEPTHELIELCHLMGIWTDTAWCPTPAGRCFRRKDYYANRPAPGTAEVWVPFDRLWRSGNRIGPSGERSEGAKQSDGRLWEELETGHEGEPLGTENGPFPGEGKDTPAHIRRSHKIFVENIKCHQCGDPILERCEQCSVRMHCMGCRKTLCASCAFNRPIPRKRAKTRHTSSFIFGTTGPTGAGVVSTSSASASASPSPSPSQSQQSRQTDSRRLNRFWWAPGATRSPNLMNEMATEDDSSDSENDGPTAVANAIVPPAAPAQFGAANTTPPTLNMHWCCLEPIFSGGGGIAILGPNVGGSGADKIRAAPLPRNQSYEDPDFQPPPALALRSTPDTLRGLSTQKLYQQVLGDNVDILPYLRQETLKLQADTCPRSLCQDCYRTFRWKVSCRGCKKGLCREHDFRVLKVRKCGYRDLTVEREWVRIQAKKLQFEWERRGARGIRVDELEIPEWKPKAPANGAAVAKGNGKGKEVELSTSSEAKSLRQETMEILDELNSIEEALAAQAAFESFDPSSHASPADGQGPFFSSGSRRHRSLSFSGTVNHASSTFVRAQAEREQHLQYSTHASKQNPGSVAASSANIINNCIPLPGHPAHPVQWEGCGAYFCHQYRPVGDGRGRCTATLRECTECGVLVCEGCHDKNQTYLKQLRERQEKQQLSASSSSLEFAQSSSVASNSKEASPILSAHDFPPLPAATTQNFGSSSEGGTSANTDPPAYTYASAVSNTKLRYDPAYDPTACLCAYCSNNYHCPSCAKKEAVLGRCVRRDEIKAEREREVAEREKKEKAKREREEADRWLGGVGEFWEGVGVSYVGAQDE